MYKKVVIGILSVVLMFGAIYFVVIPISGVFAKKGNEVNRDVYESNPQYIKGVADDIAKYMYDYNSTDDEDKKTSIRQVVNHRFADVDLNSLNDLDLVNFVRDCKRGK